MTICSNLLMFIIYFLGFSNAFQAGNEYIVALNFEVLVTDSQWDACVAISTAVKIDISYDKFDYKKSLKNAFMFMGVVVLCVLIPFFSLYNIYQVNLQIALIYLSMDLLDMAITPFNYIYKPFYQLKFSAIFTTIFAVGEKTLRVLLSVFLYSAFCTGIGQVIASYIQVIVYVIIRFKFFKLNKEGVLERKTVKQVEIT